MEYKAVKARGYHGIDGIINIVIVESFPAHATSTTKNCTRRPKASACFTNLPANKVLRLIVSGAIANPDIYFSNDNGSSYRTTNEYAHLGFMWRTDESYATSNWYKDSTANGLLYINGWFGQGTYGSGLDITFYNMSSSSRASTSFAWSTGSHQRSNPETTLGFQSASLNTRETNNAMRLDTRSGDTNISYILLSGDES